MRSFVPLFIFALLHGIQAAPLNSRRSLGLAHVRRTPEVRAEVFRYRRQFEDFGEEDLGLVDDSTTVDGVDTTAVDTAVQDENLDLAAGDALDPTAVTGEDEFESANNINLNGLEVASNDDIELVSNDATAGDETLAGGAGNDVILAAAAIPQTSLNAATLNLVKSFEGFEDQPRDDGVGNPTAGFGHKCIQTGCAEVPFSFPLSRADGEALLLTDMQEGIDCVNDNVNVALNENQFGALASFSFNAGCGTLRSSTLLRRLNAGEDPDAVAGAELPKFNKATDQRTGKKIVLNGLTRRRTAEVALFQTPP